MRKIKLKKLIPQIVLMILLIYMLCLIYCTIVAFQMKSITYSSSGFGVVLEEYKLDFEENSAVLSYYNFDGDLTSNTEVALSSAQETKIRLICAISFMPFWRSRYVNPYIQDGYQWETIISYNNKAKEIYGSNLRPLTFHFVFDTIMHVFETTN